MRAWGRVQNARVRARAKRNQNKKKAEWWLFLFSPGDGGPRNEQVIVEPGSRGATVSSSNCLLVVVLSAIAALALLRWFRTSSLQLTNWMKVPTHQPTRPYLKMLNKHQKSVSSSRCYEGLFMMKQCSKRPVFVRKQSFKQFVSDEMEFQNRVLIIKSGFKNRVFILMRSFKNRMLTSKQSFKHHTIVVTWSSK